MSEWKPIETAPKDGPKFCFVSEATDGTVYVSVFDGHSTAPVEQYNYKPPKPPEQQP